MASRFGKVYRNPLTIRGATTRIEEQIHYLNGGGRNAGPERVRGALLTANLRTYRSGDGYLSDQKAPEDPGVALYFDLDDVPHCLPCDRCWTVEENMAAIAAHIDALRGIERWGVGDLRMAFAGYAALPDPNRVIWRDVFGVPAGWTPPHENLIVIYRQLRSKHHPDRGGHPAEFDRVVKAYQLACEELGYAGTD